jgi:hypothetical protein
MDVSYIEELHGHKSIEGLEAMQRIWVSMGMKVGVSPTQERIHKALDDLILKKKTVQLITGEGL